MNGQMIRINRDLLMLHEGRNVDFASERRRSYVLIDVVHQIFLHK